MSAGFLVITAVILVVLAALSALFSAIETALFSLQPFQLRRLREKNPQLAESLARLMENPRRLLSAILLGDAAVNLPLMILCIFVLRELAPTEVHFWAEALVVFSLIVLACDLVPKLVALALPYRVAKIGGQLFSRLMPVLDPFCRVLQAWSEKIADAITPDKMQPHHFLSEEELETLVQLSAEEGALQITESELIQEIIRLGGKTVKDCMTPRIDAFAIADDLTNEQAIAELKTKRHRRVPVYGDTPDDILGVLDVRTFLLVPSAHYTEVMIPASFVPETMRAGDLLRNFLKHPQGMAVIVDEFGGTEGVITLSDLIEEIISDAVPSGDRSLYIENMGGGRLIANGNARLDDLEEITGVKIEADGIDTIGGLIFNRLGYLPKPGTYFQLDDLSCTIRRTSRKRVEEVLIAVHGDHETDEMTND
jgi:CBS domain containing-hemolysin-like protein